MLQVDKVCVYFLLVDLELDFCHIDLDFCHIDLEFCHIVQRNISRRFFS